MAAERGVVGAALVVGGGIAGVQAALDLADSGIKVYLVEKQPAIGGHMAQLDKTFPTNDCATCILSPKLVECARHRNIEIITNAELVTLSGQPGDFTATIRRMPRYVDVDKCTSCGDCAEVCPIEVPSEFDEGLSLRKAIYKPSPQAVPNAYAITKRGISPCKNACPADTSAQGYIALIAQRRYAEALEVIKQYNPFPATVGRVCHHPCESVCNRGLVDEPIAICALKRFVADHQAGEPVTPPERKYPEEIAVVGSGPAGLSAAHHLARMGYGVTVFEALPVAGGMMRVGIPAYRLPREVLEREIDDIRKLGVEIRLNSPVHDINALFRQGYKAIFLAVGAHEPQELGIPGEEGPGVLYGVAFLRAVSLSQPVELGERVIVIGGGNTAIDTARTALRLGAREVILAYRRTRVEMPAHAREVASGEAEGVRLEFLIQPIEVLRSNGRLSGVKFIRMRLGEPDESGRRRPIPIEGSEFVMEADTMIAAVAQAPEISLLAPDHGLEITRWRTFAVDPDTLATNRPGIFAGGDAALGPGALIDAIAAGRRGAISIHRYLRGLPLRTAREEQPLPVAELSREEIEAKLARGEIRRQPRVQMPTAPVEVRVGDFREVELGLTEEQAVAEAQRCLACGICSECYQCVNACQAGAIIHEEVERTEELRVGAVILATGYAPYDARLSQEYGYGRYPNVITSLQFERMLSASGPTRGHITRPSDGREPQRIAFLQCVGSRDREHDYCSAVCCMYATKEAMLALEHLPDAECHIFMIDMRAFSKGFEAYFERAKALGIRYIRCRVGGLREDPSTKDLVFQYEAEGGEIKEERFDLVVLSVGLEVSPEAKALAQTLGIELNEHGFCWTPPFHPVETSRPGVFVCGAFSEPKDIPESVIQASGAAAAALSLLGPARGTLVEEKIYPPEIALEERAEPRIGVFVCHCGSNIAGFLDVARVTEYAGSLPNVVHAEDMLYTCSADALKLIQERIREFGLNRVVVASCTPRTHEPLFRETIREAGLNPYLFEMANIRDQCSWVHSHDWEGATRKAQDLVRMAVGRARLLEPLREETLEFNHNALIIGGGLAGMTAALSLAEQGFPVYLVEREPELGGHLRRIGRSLDGSDPRAYLDSLIEWVTSHERIEVLTGAQVIKAGGFVGNFQTTVASTDDPTQRLLEHGVTIVATGAREWRGSAYLLGQDPRVMTQDDLEELLAKAEDGGLDAGTLNRLNSLVMIQCVGPWNEDPGQEFYCSRICCGVAVKNAIRIKELNPAARVYILYKEMRTYGFKEALYTQARAKGVIFLHYKEGAEPQVQVRDGRLRVEVMDTILGQRVVLAPDLLVLSTAMVAYEGSQELSSLLKIPCGHEGFFVEAHVKLRPVDFPVEGLFLCGAAHYPKFADETIAQAQAAAARAATILSQRELHVGGVVATVEAEKCTGCLTCVRVCPFNVPYMDPMKVGAGGILGAAEIPLAACQGCGICAAECPAKAIQLMHYTDAQVVAKVDALLGAAMPAQATS